jgi:hypothetical protein
MDLRENGERFDLVLQNQIEGTALVYAGREYLVTQAEENKFSFAELYPESLARMVQRASGALNSDEFDVQNEVLIESLSIDELKLAQKALEGLRTQQSLGRRIKEASRTSVYGNPNIEWQFVVSGTATIMAQDIDGFIASRDA